MLGRVLLSGEDVYKKISVLSGGERAKLAFALLMMERGNVLILDEPTNHLDLWSKELLEEALLDYRGTLIFVSHDRYLLQRVPDHIIELFGDRIEIFPGNYDYYLEKQEQQALAAARLPVPEKEKKSSGGGYRSKEERARQAQERARLKELETQIEALEAEIAAIEADLQNPDAFAGDYQQMQDACLLLEQKKKDLAGAMDEWVALG